jgi:hypothetical protein
MANKGGLGSVALYQQTPPPSGAPPAGTPAGAGYGGYQPPISQSNPLSGLAGLLAVAGAIIVLAAFIALALLDLKPAMTVGMSSGDIADLDRILEEEGVKVALTGWDMTRVTYGLASLSEAMGLPDTGDDALEFGAIDYLVIAGPIAGILGLAAAFMLMGSGNQARGLWQAVSALALLTLVYLGYVYLDIDAEELAIGDLSTFESKEGYIPRSLLRY